MKKVSHKIVSLLMAFVLLFSTMSFTINMHYCGETLMDSAIFKKAEACGMEMENPLTDSCSISKKNCCSDEIFVVDGQDELQLQVEKISFGINAGQKIALIAQNGSGKTTLLKCLVGDEDATSGSIKWSENSEIGYYAQDHAHEFEEDLPLLDWVGQWRQEGASDGQAASAAYGGYGLARSA